MGTRGDLSCFFFNGPAPTENYALALRDALPIPASEFEGTVTVGVSAVAHDGTAISAPGTTSTNLIVRPVAHLPVGTASAPTANARGTNTLPTRPPNPATPFSHPHPPTPTPTPHP